MFGLQLSLTRKLWVTLFETLQIKWKVKYFMKKSSCVFPCASFIPATLLSCVYLLLCRYDAAWTYICIFLHDAVDHYITPTRVAPDARPLAWLRRASESQPSSPEAGLNSLTYSKSPKSSARFQCVTSPTRSTHVSHLGNCDISEWHVRSARTPERLR